MESRVALALTLVIFPFVALLAGTGAVSAAVGLGPWQTIGSLPDQRGDTAAAKVGDYMYVIGGTANMFATNSIYYAMVNVDGLGSPHPHRQSMVREHEATAAAAYFSRFRD